jgi:RNA polymerase sigma-70 factor (ECF subfamily)
VAIAPEQWERSGHSDRALVEAHQRGDAEAFAAIVARYYPLLLKQAHYRMGNRSEAEDVVQEAFERAFRAFDRFGGEYRVAPWLSHITSNVCASHGARRTAFRELPQRVGLRDVADQIDATELVSDPTVLTTVRAAIDALPVSQRSTFLLHEVTGLSYPEVADQLGISEDNARARVHRAKAALRLKLASTRASLGAALGLPSVSGGFLRTRTGQTQSSLGAGNAALSPVAHGCADPVDGVKSMAGASGPFTGSPPGSLAWSSLQHTAGQVAAQMSSGPIGQVAMAAAPGARDSLVMGVVAGIAAVTTVAFAGPGGVAVPAAAAPPVIVAAPITLQGARTGTTLPPLPQTPAPLAQQTSAPQAPAAVPAANSSTSNSSPPAVPPVPPATPSRASWIAAAAAALPAVGGTAAATPAGGQPVSETERGAAGSAVGEPVSSASCPWLTTFPGAAPGSVATTSAFNGSPVATLGTAQVGLDVGATTMSSPVLATSASLNSVAAGGVTTSVRVLAGLCLPPTSGALIVDLTGVAGDEIQLRGGLVASSTTASAVGYLFRGTAVVLTSANSATGSVDGTFPWGASDRFVAQVIVRPSDGTAQMAIAFLSPDPTTPAGSAGVPGSPPAGSAGVPGSTTAGSPPAGSAGVPGSTTVGSAGVPSSTPVGATSVPGSTPPPSA